jgi:hypothetical protein
MSLKNKNASNLIVGTSVNSKNIVNFYELDNLLSSLTVNIDGSIDSSVETSAIQSIIKLFGLTSLTNGLMIASGRYLIKDENNNIIKENELRNYAFSFFEVSNSNKQKIENSVSYLTKIQININQSKFESFIIYYLPKTYQTIGLDFVQVISKLFISALKNFIERNNISSYCFYETYSREEKSTNNNTNYYDINPQYNYYIENYENTFNENFSYLNLLPNYYALNSYLINDNGNSTSHLSLGQQVVVTKKTVGSKEYFNNFAKVIKSNSNNSQFLTTYSSNFNSFLIDTTTNKTKQVSTENFPYVNTIKFSNIETSISNYLIENGLDFLSLNNSYSSFYSLATPQTLFIKQITNTTKQEDSNGEFVDVNGVRYNNIYSNKLESSSIQNIAYADVFDFNSTTQPYGFKIKTNSAFVFENNLSNLQGVQNIFKSIKLNNYFYNLYDKYNDYETVKNLNILISDPICYFVEKLNNNNSLLQTAGLVVENDNELVFNDTQTAYNKLTNYNVYSADVVPEIELNFNNINIIDNLSLNLDTITTIKPKIYKNLIFSTTSKIIDSPPIAPTIRFVTYQNISTKLSLFFNTSIASIRENAIKILASDQQQIDNLQLLQKIKDGKIKYESDDSLSTVQIFRTTTRPYSYLDFSNSLLEEVSFNNFSSTSYLMDVQENTKYYMTFRGIDVHGLVSNPTEVFELEIINNNGAVYSVVNTINFDNKINYNLNKNFRKYLNIKPSFDYSQINLFENDEIKYGNDDKLWKQKFKIRITSKKSGKAFDVNLTYVKKEQDLT